MDSNKHPWVVRLPTGAFGRYMVSTAVSNLAHVTFLLVITWAAAAHGHMLASAGAFVLAGWATRLVITPIAGEIADRVAGRQVVHATRKSFALLALASPVALHTSHVWGALLALQIATSALLRIEQPAHRMLVSQFAGGRPRARAFAVNSAMFHLAEMVGAGIAVLTLTRVPATVALLGAGALLYVSAHLLAHGQINTAPAAQIERAGWASIRVAVVGSPAFALALMLPAAPGLVDKLIVTSAPVLGSGAIIIGLIAGIPAGAALLVTLATVRIKASDTHLLASGMVGVGVLLAIVLLSTSVSSWGVTGILVLAGIGAARAYVGLMSAAWIQLHAPPGTVGRMGAL